VVFGLITDYNFLLGLLRFGKSRERVEGFPRVFFTLEFKFSPLLLLDSRDKDKMITDEANREPWLLRMRDLRLKGFTDISTYRSYEQYSEYYGILITLYGKLKVLEFKIPSCFGLESRYCLERDGWYPIDAKNKRPLRYTHHRAAE